VVPEHRGKRAVAGGALSARCAKMVVGAIAQADEVAAFGAGSDVFAARPVKSSLPKEIVALYRFGAVGDYLERRLQSDALPFETAVDHPAQNCRPFIAQPCS
jgi:hypothetical protein